MYSNGNYTMQMKKWIYIDGNYFCCKVVVLINLYKITNENHIIGYLLE